MEVRGQADGVRVGCLIRQVVDAVEHLAKVLEPVVVAVRLGPSSEQLAAGGRCGRVVDERVPAVEQVRVHVQQCARLRTGDAPPAVPHPRGKVLEDGRPAVIDVDQEGHGPVTMDLRGGTGPGR